MASVSAPRRQPATPGLGALAIVAAIALILATVALTAKTPPPPTIAEFAPQVAEQITEAPSDQASTSGSGAGGDGAGDGPGSGSGDGPGATSTTLAVADEGIDVARVRRCIGNPPRQIEDPQSPPCVPYFKGENGGATSKGVTATEVRVAIPPFPDKPEGFDELEAFFNRRFEFYGRKLVFVDFTPKGTCNAPDQVADAVAVDSMNVFAAGKYNQCFGYFYGEELARRKIIYASDMPNLTEAHMASRRPYLWQYPMAADRMFATMGDWLCQRLAGQPARFAGSPTLQAQTRKFAVLLRRPVSVPAGVPTADPVTQRLEACNAKAVYISDAQSSLDETNTVIAMSRENATTVLCLCEYSDQIALQKGASGQGYFPEWIFTTYRGQDTNFIFAYFGDQTQNNFTLGLTFHPRQSRPSDEPERWAVSEVDPDGGAEGRNQHAGARLQFNNMYRTMLLIASGIQMAGPNLTPETFEAGLQRTVFPNPDTPIKAGRVGFANRSHAMTLDAAEWWWSATASSPYTTAEWDQGRGAMCYVENGRRGTIGTWPRGDAALFTSTCHTGA